MGVKWENKERFFHKLDSIVPGMAKEVRAANFKSANEMVGSAVRLAERETGALQASIRMSPWERTGYVVEAGGETTTKTTAAGTYDYSHAVEWGTQKMRARPFFWPAYRLMRRTFKGRITRAIRKSVKAAGF